MDRKQFSEAYAKAPRNTFFESLPDELSLKLEPFEEWSTYFGDYLYDLMRDDETAAHQRSRQDDLLAIRNYIRHTKTHSATESLPTIHDLLTADSGIDRTEKPEILSRLVHTQNFHLMSQIMTVCWSEMIWGGSLPPNDRARTLNIAAFNLSQSALDYVEWRNSAASIEHSHRYFSDDEKMMRSTSKGILTEIDTAITLVALSRRDPNLIVVPAPRRFEDANDRFNVDFLVYHTETDELVGVQSKTHITDEHRRRYDESRVVLISADEDLGAVTWARTEAGKSVTKPVAWPGMIAMSFLDTIKLHGQKNTGFEQYSPASLLKLKQRARVLLQSPYDSNDNRRLFRTAQDNVKAKLYPKLGLE